MTLSLAEHTFLQWQQPENSILDVDTSLSNAVPIQLYITNDACQPQMDPHNCYFEHLIIQTENLTIPFDRHTSLQW